MAGYKQKYLDEVKERESVEYDLRIAESRLKTEKKANLGLHGTIDGMREVSAKIEGKEFDLTRENDWLKRTIRLIVVPNGNIRDLHEILKREAEEKSGMDLNRQYRVDY